MCVCVCMCARECVCVGECVWVCVCVFYGDHHIGHVSSIHSCRIIVSVICEHQPLSPAGLVGNGGLWNSPSAAVHHCCGL